MALRAIVGWAAPCFLSKKLTQSPLVCKNLYSKDIFHIVGSAGELK
jgi:hypothetical protein